MANADKGPNKSAFLRELFRKKPDLKEPEATEAWQKAGNEGEIGSSLYYNVKREFQGGANAKADEPRKAGPKASSKMPKGERSGRVDGPSPESGGKASPKVAASESGAGERERVLDRVEDGIDDLIIELKRLGGMEEGLEALRKVRPVVVRRHEG